MIKEDNSVMSGICPQTSRDQSLLFGPMNNPVAKEKKKNQCSM